MFKEHHISELTQRYLAHDGTQSLLTKLPSYRQRVFLDYLVNVDSVVCKQCDMSFDEQRRSVEEFIHESIIISWETH